MGYVFEWDSRKERENARKHRVSFVEATTVFGDPRSLRLDDPDHSQDEMRYLLLGVSIRDRVLVVAFVERHSRVRLISARRATRRERSQYEEEI